MGEVLGAAGGPVLVEQVDTVRDFRAEGGGEEFCGFEGLVELQVVQDARIRAERGEGGEVGFECGDKELFVLFEGLAGVEWRFSTDSHEAPR